MSKSSMRQIVNGNDSMNIMLNEIVNREMDKTLDDMIEVVRGWKESTEAVSCDVIIRMLESKKS